MTPEKANQIIRKAGFEQSDVLAPCEATKGRMVIVVKTEKRGWMRKWIASDAGDPASQLAAWLSTLS